jgi:hypothetical protein
MPTEWQVSLPQFPQLIVVATVLIVTDVLLAMVMFLVWGLIFVIPIFYILFFGLVDGVFWACTPPPFIHTY